MSREEIFEQCVQEIAKTNCIMLEAATGVGKTSISIRLVNHLMSNSYLVNHTGPVNILILVAKRVHKQTWKDEIEKWGGFHHPNEDYLTNINVCMECYESLKNHCKEHWDVILGDEIHHIASETRLGFLKTMSFCFFIGLSATIPMKLKQYFKYKYHAGVVSCDIIEAIEDEVLPEPTILLFPLQVENSRVSEVLELHPKASGPVIECEYKDLKRYKFKNVHIKCKCTQAQKLLELDNMIRWFKDKAFSNPRLKQTWLYFCGKRLEFLADCKMQWVKLILHKLKDERTITFCKTIAQTEELGKNCIHSQNKDATKVYEDFNKKKIDHITAVNILNENANLVDCRYGVFCNITSSDIITRQRQGRLLRHKDPIMVIPYYKGTREEELVLKGIEGFKSVKTIHSISEI